ncbi:MAG: ADP-ribosylation factor-like protein [Candidatus Thorarchaeota archaeon]
MIHNVVLIKRDTGEIVTRVRFWKIEFNESHIREFLVGYHDLHNTEGLAKDTPIYVGQHKVFHSPVGEDMILLFATNGRDEDRTIQYKVRESAARIETALRGNTPSYIRDNLDDILGELVFTHFKVSFVGAGGVGKSTLLRLLFGKEPAPGGYVPTINVAVDASETIQFGTFLVTIWDFAGQAVFHDLWGFYFQGTDVIFLITDSSFRNVMQTKTLLRNIRKEAPAVPLFIIANKQDLPESMRADKIQRLLGAPTFPMVATDKSRREEFIRFMLEVAAKTVGVELPDRPLSEMITVRRRTEDIFPDQSAMPRHTQTGYETVPYEESSPSAGSPRHPEESQLPSGAEASPTGQGADTTAVPTPVGEVEEAKILHLMILVHHDGLPHIAFELNYGDEPVQGTAVASLISALDSFTGIDAETPGVQRKTDALETIQHEGNLIMVEKSANFLIAVTVTNDSREEEQRREMSSILVDMEEQYANVWDTWDGDASVFEPSVFRVLTSFPLCEVGFDYVVRSREAGKPLPFKNREVGRAIVTVKSAVDGTTTVGGLVRSLDLPREVVLGCLQIMVKYGWVDFQVVIGPKTILKKKRDVDADLQKIYGEAVVKFVDMCDGTLPLEDVVRKIPNVSLSPMKFVATKLVLGGVLEIVA